MFCVEHVCLYNQDLGVEAGTVNCTVEGKNMS
jgi:hypothetical protein